MGLDNPIHIAFLLLIVLLVFGAKRLPELGRSLGTGMREFKESVTGQDRSTLTPMAQPAPMAQPMPMAQQAPIAQPVAQAAPVVVPPPVAPPVAMVADVATQVEPQSQA